MATAAEIITQLLAGDRITCGPLDGRWLAFDSGRLRSNSGRDAAAVFVRFLERSDWATWSQPASDWEWAFARLRERTPVRHSGMPDGAFLHIAGGEVRRGMDGSADTTVYALGVADFAATDWTEHTPVPPQDP